jgi:glycosyltransferase involved in cell wall biosynthesis
MIIFVSRMDESRKLGLIIDTDHFFKSFIPRIKENFEVRTYNPPQLTGDVASAEDIRKLVTGHMNDLVNIEKVHNWADVVFYEWASRLLVKGTKKKKKCKIVTRLHRYEVYYYIDKVDWSKVDGVIFVCDAIRRKFLAHPKVKKEFQGRTKVIWNYLDLSQFPFSDHGSSKQIGILAYAQHRKRFYSLVLAHNMALKKHPDLVLRIAGVPKDKEYLDAIKMLIEKLGIEDRVKLDGYVEDLGAWYRDLDIIVSNSTHESTNLTLFEGAASGAYPLCHIWDGAEEFLPEENLYTDAEDYVRHVDEFYSLSGDEQLERRKGIHLMLKDRFDQGKQIESLVEELQTYFQ